MENMAIGLSTSLIGMVIVFLILILLAAILSAFKFIFAENEPSPKEVRQPIPQEPDNIPDIIAVTPSENDDELVAAISVAVACSLGTTVDRIAVRSVRKTSASGWSEAALRESMK